MISDTVDVVSLSTVLDTIVEINKYLVPQALGVDSSSSLSFQVVDFVDFSVDSLD